MNRSFKKAFTRIPNSRLQGQEVVIISPDPEPDITVLRGNIIEATGSHLKVEVSRKAGPLKIFTQSIFFRRDTGTSMNLAEPVRIDIEALFRNLTVDPLTA